MTCFDMSISGSLWITGLIHVCGLIIGVLFSLISILERSENGFLVESWPGFLALTSEN